MRSPPECLTVMTPRPAITPEKDTTPSPALTTTWPTAADRSTPRCPDDHWLFGCSNRRRTAGRGANGQTKPRSEATRVLAPAGPSVPVRRVVVGAAVVGGAAAVVGAADAPAVWAVVATGVPAVGHAAVGERATAATSAADAAEYRIRMGPRFLFSGRRAKVQGQPVDNVTNRHTPVDGALSGPAEGQVEGRRLDS